MHGQPSTGFSRRQFLRLGAGMAVSSLLLPAAAHASSRTSSQAKNVIFIMSDQHRADITGCYGSPHIATPHIDLLASQGVRFDSMYCQYPYSVPSRMSIICSQYAATHEARGNIMPKDRTSLLDDLRRSHGVHTWFCGVDKMPTRSFEVCINEETVFSHFPPEVGQTWWTAFEDYLAQYPGEVRTQSKLNTQYLRLPVAEDGYPDGLFASMAETILANQTGRPILFWIGLVAPHPPWVLPDPYWTAYRYRDLPTPTQPPPEILQGLPLYLRQRYHDEFAFLTQEEITAGVRAYYGFVEFMDHVVGRVLDTLEEYGLVRDTIVIYTTDHGEMLGHNGMWLKDCLYEYAVRVPCIIRYPGAIPPGQVVPKCAEQIDLFPTLYDYLDIPPDGMEEGVSLRGLIANPDDPAWVDEAYAEDLTLYKMVRAGQWKYHRYPGDADHLHDLESDPGEVINLIDDPQYAEIKAYLLGRLAAKFGNPRSRYPLERA